MASMYFIDFLWFSAFIGDVCSMASPPILTGVATHSPYRAVADLLWCKSRPLRQPHDLAHAYSSTLVGHIKGMSAELSSPEESVVQEWLEQKQATDFLYALHFLYFSNLHIWTG